MKVLIIELWGIGDAVMMSAVLKPLRQAFPDAEIAVLCQEHGKEILRANAEVSRFIAFRFPWIAFRGKYFLWQWDWAGMMKLIRGLRREKFDVILDARGDPRNALLSRLIGARQILSRDSKTPGKHRVDHWAALLRMLGVPSDGLRPSINVTVQEKQESLKFLSENFSKQPRILVGIHPGAAQRVRCWPLDRFQGVAQRLLRQADIGVAVLTGPDGHGRAIAKDLRIPCFSGDLRGLAAVVAELDILVCNDTGVMHIATAVDTPVVAVFGPGDPAFIGPRGDAEIVISPCEHRPCFDACRFERADCLERISVEEVASAVLKKIRSLEF